MGTVGTVGTWRSDAIAVGTFFGIVGTCSHVFWEQNIGKDRWEHGNIAFWRHLQNVPTVFLVGTRKKMFPLFFAGTWEHLSGNIPAGTWEHSFFSEFIFIEIWKDICFLSRCVDFIGKKIKASISAEAFALSQHLRFSLAFVFSRGQEPVQIGSRKFLSCCSLVALHKKGFRFLKVSRNQKLGAKSRLYQ